jgi:hypothetical protein
MFRYHRIVWGDGSGGTASYRIKIKSWFLGDTGGKKKQQKKVPRRILIRYSVL